MGNIQCQVTNLQYKFTQTQTDTLKRLRLQ